MTLAINRQGAEWKVLKHRCEKRIDAWRDELEAMTVAPQRADHLRGMIAATRELIEEVEPTPTPNMQEVKYG